MTSATIRSFYGLFLQPGAQAPAGALLVADNVSLTPNAALARRPALVFRGELPATSAGLFAMGDELHHAAATGTSITGLMPTIYTHLLSTASMAKVHGVIANALGEPLLVTETDSGGVELHLSEGPNAEPAGTTKLASTTEIEFTPASGGLAKLGTRAWVIDQDATGAVRHSAVDDPTNPTALRRWLTTADDGGGGVVPDNLRGGRIDIGQHDAGGRRPVGLGVYNGRLAVFFAGSVQVWRIGTDFGDLYLEQQLNGPGLLNPEALAAVADDLIFLTPALTVQALSTAGATLAASSEHLGTDVEPLIVATYDNAITPVAFYSRARSQLLIALGTDVLVLSLRPGAGRIGWTRWRLPVAVDHFAETESALWMRSGTALYSFDDAEDNDEVALGDERAIDVRVETASLGDEEPGQKVLRRVAAILHEETRCQVVTDGRPAVADDGSLPVGIGTAAMLPAKQPGPSTLMCSRPGRAFGVRLHRDAAPATWRCDGVYLDYSTNAPRGLG